MDADRETINEIKKNTAVTREKVENLEAHLESTKKKQRDHDNQLDNHETRLTRIEVVGTVIMALVTIVGAFGAWVAPLL